jgi:hypothetical protein
MKDEKDEPATPESSREEEQANSRETSTTPTRYRQYLVDRAKGTSKVDGGAKPPCSACYVPMPVIWLSGLIEQNCVFEWLGKVGCVSPNNLKARRYCIGFGLFLNILGTGAALYTCCSLSLNYDTLAKASFTNGGVTLYIPTLESDGYPPGYRTSEQWRTRIGMRGVGIRQDYPDAYQDVIDFDDFCELQQGKVFPISEDAKCDDCADISPQITQALLISLIMCFPSLTTDVLRLYPGYDCNCQKVFASFSSIISIVFAFYTIWLYQNKCFSSFGWGVHCVLEPSMVDDDSQYYIPSFELGPSAGSNDCPPEYTTVYRNFWLGPGWGALLATGFFKIADTLLNLAIPTPTICRDRDEQREYELLAQQDTEENEADEDSAAGVEIDEEESTPAPVEEITAGAVGKAILAFEGTS